MRLERGPIAIGHPPTQGQRRRHRLVAHGRLDTLQRRRRKLQCLYLIDRAIELAVLRLAERRAVLRHLRLGH